MRLYELTEAYQNVSNLIEMGLPEEEIAQVLDTLEGAIEEKAGNIALMIQNMDADIEAIKAEESRLYDRRKALENKKTSLKQYLEDNFKAMGIKNVKTPTHTIALQNNPPGVYILDEKALPDVFLRHFEKWEPDKKMILQALKDGQEVPGAEIQQTQGLRIR